MPLVLLSSFFNWVTRREVFIFTPSLFQIVLFNIKILNNLLKFDDFY